MIVNKELNPALRNNKLGLPVMTDLYGNMKKISN